MPYIGNAAGNRFVASKAASVYSGNGSTTAFTLEHAVGSDEDILVSVDGVIQEPSVAYAVSSGTTLTFTAAPSSNSGNNIFVYYLFRTVATVDHPSTSALSATTGTFSSTLNVTGVLTGTSLDISGDIDVDGTTNLDNTDIDGNLDVTGASNSVVTLIKPQGALADNNDNAGLYVLHQGTAGTGLRVRTDNALTGSNFAHVLVNNASASINAFQVSQYGSGLIAKFDKSGTTAMQIDNTGAVTKPLQPAFLARMSAVQSNVAVNSNVQLNFASEIFDQNSDYNNSTSVFTAPVTGRYQFSFILRVDALDAAADYYSFFLDTSNRSDMRYLFNPDIGTTAGQDVDRFPALLSMLVDMDAGDTAKVQVYQANGSAQTDIISDSYFSGYLVA